MDHFTLVVKCPILMILLYALHGVLSLFYQARKKAVGGILVWLTLGVKIFAYFGGLSRPAVLT